MPDLPARETPSRVWRPGSVLVPERLVEFWVFHSGSKMLRILGGSMPGAASCLLVAVVLDVLSISSSAAGWQVPAAVGSSPTKIHVPPRNVVLIVADDIGVDMLSAYGEGNDLPTTPNLDALAAGGVTFRNAWSNPVCSPSRATIQTGRYAFRYDMLWIVTALSSFGLAESEICLPEALDAFSPYPYHSAAIGKWHLAGMTPTANFAPNIAGYEHFQGTLFGFHKNPPNGYYYLDNQLTNGVPSTVTSYNSTLVADDAIAWWNGHTGHRFAYVAFNAPHAPYQNPPQNLCTIDLQSCPPGDRSIYKAMVEAMDHEIGRLVSAVRQNDPDAVILFCGDNGTPQYISVAPFDPQRAKGTIYEGGVNVPLIVSGPIVKSPGRFSDGLVNLTDLFATVLELSAADLDTVKLAYANDSLDSKSLVPYLTTPNLPSLRSAVYTEMKAITFQGPGPLDRAARNAQFKLRRIGLTPLRDELYDLLADPFEKVNLTPGGDTSHLTAEQLAEYQQLSSYIENPVTP